MKQCRDGSTRLPQEPCPDEIEAQKRDECYRQIRESADEARRVAHNWIDGFFNGNKMPVPSIPLIIRTAIAGAEGAVIEGMVGASGALAGGFVGAVVSMSAAVIISPVAKPILAGVARGLAEVEILRSALELQAILCDKNPLSGLTP